MGLMWPSGQSLPTTGLTLGLVGSPLSATFQTTNMSRLDIDHQYKALVSRSEQLLTAMQKTKKEEEERERLRRIQEEMEKERQRREQEEQQRLQEVADRRL